MAHRIYDLEKSVAELARSQLEIAARLAVIDRKLDLVAADASKMSAHVTFVESIYEQVKRPFHFLMGRADAFAGPAGAGSGSLADSLAGSLAGSLADRESPAPGSPRLSPRPEHPPKDDDTIVATV